MCFFVCLFVFLTLFQREMDPYNGWRGTEMFDLEKSVLEDTSLGKVGEWKHES